ncbi:MAG: hypothetical protein K9N35_10200 [Candidatus Marinimicrobia bacterium]|nr:hypothetical protein [Candidatus Neomarinimicrobiota bacterium]
MYIVAIMITAVVFSITGLGVMNLALLVNLDTQAAVQFSENQIDLESEVNIALWRLNAGDDTLGTYTSDNFTSTFDSASLTLTLSMAIDGDTSGFQLQLEEDYHFTHALASQNNIDTYNYTINEEPDHEVREKFEFLPIVDEAYWLSVADSIFTDNSKTFHDWDLIEGILVFTGNDLKFQDIDVENTTMVFTGDGVMDFTKSNTLKAAYNDSTIYPALVFTDSTSYFFINEWLSLYKDHIEGAIFSYGTVVLRTGELSGPVVGNNILVWKNMNFLDDQYPQYYGWPVGFGDFKDYDWPKQIVQWESF